MNDNERKLMDELKQAHIRIVQLEDEKKLFWEKEDKLEKLEIEYLNQLDDLDIGDAEGSHFIADNLLIELIREIGMDSVADAFEQVRDRIGFWYA